MSRTNPSPSTESTAGCVHAPLPKQFKPFQIHDLLAFYAHGRVEEPVFYDPELGYWVIVRNEDIKAIFRDQEILSFEVTKTLHKQCQAEIQLVLKAGGCAGNSGLLGRVPPDHTCPQCFINKAFTPRRMQVLELRTCESAMHMIDTFAHNEHANLVAQLVYKLPALMIFILQGTPDADVPNVKIWANSRVLLNFSGLPKECLSFGFGIHHCLGGSLARQEACIVLEDLTSRLLQLSLEPDQAFTFSPNTSFRGPQQVWGEWNALVPYVPFKGWFFHESVSHGTGDRERATPQPAPSQADSLDNPPKKPAPESPYVLPFEACTHTDLQRVGGKCANLGTMLRFGASVPPGFAITTDAYRAMLVTDGVQQRIRMLLEQIIPNDVSSEETASRAIRSLIELTPIPSDVEMAIRGAYTDLCVLIGMPDVPVAVRSSATAEDLPDASFAGQQDTFLWIIGANAVLEHMCKCWSSLFTARAIAYRNDHGVSREQVLMSVAVQKMVNAKAAGVAMTLNPLNGDRSKIVIEASWGLGETVVSGAVTPDNFVVDKVLLEVIKRKISAKAIELAAEADKRCVVERPIEGERQTQPSLTDDEVLAIARAAKQVERHYGAPQDIEWAIDADLPTPENVVLLQSRPETVWSQKATLPPKDSTAYQVGIQSMLHTLLRPLNSKTEETKS